MAFALLSLAGLHLLAAMVPGPNTVVIGHLAASRSRRAALAAVAGVVLASLVWVTLSLAGIGILLIEAGVLYRAARLAGACYLVYAGARLLLAAMRTGARSGATGASAGALDEGTATARPRIGRHAFVAGFLTTMSNPKSAAFWTSVFALFVPAGAPLWFHAAVVAVVAVQATAWYGLVALMLSSGPARANYQRLQRWLDGVAGTVMVLLGLKLADEVRVEIAWE